VLGTTRPGRCTDRLEAERLDAQEPHSVLGVTHPGTHGQAFIGAAAAPSVGRQRPLALARLTLVAPLAPAADIRDGGLNPALIPSGRDDPRQPELWLRTGSLKTGVLLAGASHSVLGVTRPGASGTAFRGSAPAPSVGRRRRFTPVAPLWPAAGVSGRGLEPALRLSDRGDPRQPRLLERLTGREPSWSFSPSAANCIARLCSMGYVGWN
jgi:hypothetical protein